MNSSSSSSSSTKYAIVPILSDGRFYTSMRTHVVNIKQGQGKTHREIKRPERALVYSDIDLSCNTCGRIDGKAFWHPCGAIICSTCPKDPYDNHCIPDACDTPCQFKERKWDRVEGDPIYGPCFEQSVWKCANHVFGCLFQGCLNYVIDHETIYCMYKFKLCSTCNRWCHISKWAEHVSEEDDEKKKKNIANSKIPVPPPLLSPSGFWSSITTSAKPKPRKKPVLSNNIILEADIINSTDNIPTVESKYNALPITPVNASNIVVANIIEAKQAAAAAAVVPENSDNKKDEPETKVSGLKRKEADDDRDIFKGYQLESAADRLRWFTLYVKPRIIYNEKNQELLRKLNLFSEHSRYNWLSIANNEDLFRIICKKIVPEYDVEAELTRACQSIKKQRIAKPVHSMVISDCDDN